MTEQEYIIATNRVKVSMGFQILKDVYKGKEYGIDPSKMVHVLRTLSDMEKKQFRNSSQFTDKLISSPVLNIKAVA